MAIDPDYAPTPLPDLQSGFAIVNREGQPTQHFFQLMQQWHQYFNGGNRVIPCNASTAANVITLTPLAASPLIEGYMDHDIFTFVADASTTGDVTGTVVPKTGTLPTIKFYKTNGATQAGNGDVVAGSLYLAVFNDALDSGAGGIVLK